MPLCSLESLEPVSVEVPVPGAWACASKGGGFLCAVAELFFDMCLPCSVI